MICNKDYDYVSYRLLLDNTYDVFAGCFAAKDGEIISMDGDNYDKDEEVLSYEEWTFPEEGIHAGLTVVVPGVFL